MTPASRISMVIHHNEQLLIVDFSNCHGQLYKDVFLAAKEKLLQEKKLVRVLSVFNEKTFVTPEVMRFVEHELPSVDHYILRNAIIGISTTQQWILKGLNLWYKKQIYYFATKEEAMDFLSKP